jgi:hypothetical protein
MAKFIIDKSQFLNGITYNPEFGMEDMYGTDLYREYGYMSGGFTGVNITSTAISSTVCWQILDNHNNTGITIDWLVKNGKVGKYDIDHGQYLKETNTGAGYGMGGAGLLKNFLYLGNKTDGIGKLKIGTGGALGAFTTGVFTTKTTDFKEMIPLKDVIYGCNKDSIFSITDSATFNGSALVLESNTTSISVAPYGEYLAIGAIKGYYFPSGATFHGNGMWKSKLYFWDTTSTSWDKDRSTDIEGRILKVLNKKGILYVFLKERNDSISINYFDGNAIQPIKRITPKEGTNLLNIGADAFDVKGDSIYFGVGYSGETIGRVLQYGKGEADSPIAISNPHIVFTPLTSAANSIDSIKWTKDNELTVSISDTGSGHSLKVFKSSGYYMAFEPKTPVMTTGTKQICNKIKINFKPFISEDRLYLYRNIDNAGFESSVWDSCSYTTLTGSKDFYTITREFEFSTLQLKLTCNPGTAGANNGNVRVRNIIVESEDSDEI